jgi:hypothetical protein
VVTFVNEENLALLAGREFELWKPILAIAIFLDNTGISEIKLSNADASGNKFTNTPSSLKLLVTSLGAESARQRSRPL